MTHDEKTVVICAFRFASANDLDDLPTIIDFVLKHVDEFASWELDDILGDTRFAIRLYRKGRTIPPYVVTFANKLKIAIEERQKNEGHIQKYRETREETFFFENGELQRLFFALAIAYATPRHTYIFSLLSDTVLQCLNWFSKKELNILARICQKGFPAPGVMDIFKKDQTEVSRFIDKVKQAESESEDTARNTLLCKSWFGTVFVTEKEI